MLSPTSNVFIAPSYIMQASKVPQLVTQSVSAPTINVACTLWLNSCCSHPRLSYVNVDWNIEHQIHVKLHCKRLVQNIAVTRCGNKAHILPQSIACEGVLCGKEREMDLCCIAFVILVNNTDVALVYVDKFILWSEVKLRKVKVGVLTCNQVFHVESVVLQFGCSTPDLTSEKMKLQSVLE